MLRLLAQLLLILAPLGAYVWWLLVPVRHALARGERLQTILMQLGGLAALALVEGLIFKFLILPRMAGALSERFYAGSYLPEDDPLALLARKISTENRTDLLPELTRLVEADPRRVRAWLELARLLQDHLHDTPGAVRRLLQGAESVRRKEDTALLLWRAASLLRKHTTLAPQATPLLEKLATHYPDTAYGQLAAKTSRENT